MRFVLIFLLFFLEFEKVIDQSQIYRFFYLASAHPGCVNDLGWMVISDYAQCSEWVPSELTYNPEIRYSTNTGYVNAYT